MNQSKKYLEDKKSELERAIELTKAVIRNCDTPLLKELHYEAISRYEVEIETINHRISQSEEVY